MFATVLKKMKSQYQPGTVVHYQLEGRTVEEGSFSLNEQLGKTLTLSFTGEILCLACGRKTKKSFNQGYCYPCSRQLARTDMCSVRPELCHFAKGSCREPEWGLANCMIPHTLYLANSSGLKVGITRAHHRLTRWIDQGAVEAIPVLNMRDRLSVGLAETRLKEHFADRTNWRNMLKGEVPSIDLLAEKERLLSLLGEEGERLDEAPLRIDYPVLEFPKKITSLNLDKTPVIAGTLMGIKGQYLIFDTGVINLRSFSAYAVTLTPG